MLKHASTLGDIRTSVVRVRKERTATQRIRLNIQPPYCHEVQDGMIGLLHLKQYQYSAHYK